MEGRRPGKYAKGSIRCWEKGVGNVTVRGDGEQVTEDPEDEGYYQGAVNNTSQGDNSGEG